WEDIDFKKKTLRVQHQVQWKEDRTKTKAQKKLTNGIMETGNGYWYLSNPKYDSFRTIELDEQLLQLLSRELQRQKKAEAYYAEYYTHYYEAANHAITTDPSGTPLRLVCVRESGMYIHPRTMHHTSAIIHHKMNYPDFDFHSLRHTHATMLAEHGAPPKYVQERLGHTKVELTMNIYQHVTDIIRSQGNAVLNSMYTNNTIHTYK
ncbi:MAG: tyrosine-type recombinase/integrase, partial [Clostridiales bacterium]|nr:tyrosine-type recombinase/integrase [Clostridiales bacterium]